MNLYTPKLFWKFMLVCSTLIASGNLIKPLHSNEIQTYYSTESATKYLHIKTICKMYGDNSVPPSTIKLHKPNLQSCNGPTYSTYRDLDSPVCGSHLYPEYILLCEIFDYMFMKTNRKLKKAKTKYQLLHTNTEYCNTDMCGFMESEPLLAKTDSCCTSDSLADFLAGHSANSSKIDAVFGTMDSGLAAMDAVLFAQKCIPVFPIIASTSQLDNNPNFMRTMPSDTNQVYVILQLLQQLNVTLVSVIYDQSFYGSGLFYAFQTELQNPNNNTGRVCIDLAIQLPESLTESILEHYSGLLKILMSANHSRTLVVFMNEHTFQDLVYVYNLTQNTSWLREFLVITADNAYRENFGQFAESLNIISIQPNLEVDTNEYDVGKFEKHLQSISIESALGQGKTNLAYLIAQQNGCTVGNNNSPHLEDWAWSNMTHVNPCPTGTTLPKTGPPIHQVTRIATKYIAATFIQLGEYLIAKEKNLSSTAGCGKWKSLMDSLRCNIADKVATNTYYSVFIFQNKSTGKLGMTEIGNTTKLSNQASFIQLKLNKKASPPFALLNQSYAAQTAYCRRHACGMQNNVWSFSVDCRTCIPCPSMFHYIRNPGLTCAKCPEGQRPESNVSGVCTTVKAVDYDYIKNSSFSVVTVFLAAIGLLLTFLVSFVVIRKRETPIVRVARPEVLLIQCISCTIDFVICFLAMYPMNNTLCATQWIAFCLSLAVSTTSMLSKVHQYSALRRFPPVQETELRSVMIGLIWSLCLVQVIIVLAMFVLSPPADGFVAKPDAPEYYPVCSWYNDDPTIALVAYPICLLVVATSVSFKYSNLVFTFIKREMKYILVGSSLCAGAIVVLCPVILFEIQEQQERVIWFNVLVLLVGFFKLVFLLLPSVLIVAFKPHLNTRQFVCEQIAPKISPGETWPPPDDQITNAAVMRRDLGILL